MKKMDNIINPIYDSLWTKYSMAYGECPKKNSIEFSIFEELKQLSSLSLTEALSFSYLIQQLDFIPAKRDQRLWRELAFCHLVFLFRKKVFSFDPILLIFVCDSIHMDHIDGDIRYLKLLVDYVWIQKIFHHAIYIDYSSTLTNRYKVDMERVKRVFLFFCRRIQEQLFSMPNEMDLSVLKRKILKNIRTYQSSQTFKRSVGV